MGLIYNQLKQYDKAIKCYEKAMEDKNYISLPNIWNELTRAYNKINQVDTKQVCLQKATG
jgi:lipopolysaccharide biosynthesis regulator YciM